MWVTKLLISPVKKRIFCPKNDQIWPKIGIFGQFGPGHVGLFSALLVGRLVVVARAVSRKTPIYLMYLSSKLRNSPKAKPGKATNMLLSATDHW